MALRDRAETVALVAVVLAVLAFAASAVLGVMRHEPTRVVREESGEVRLPEVSERSDVVRVEVLNGSGKPGLARRATEVLRDAGFDVVQIGNASSAARGATRVIDRVAEPGHARAVARALGAGVVESLPDRELYLDVTVILGTDWPPAKKAADEPGILDRIRRKVRPD